MGRGFLFGSFWGLVVGTVVLAVASLLGEVPGRGAPDAKLMEVPAGSQFDQAGVDQPVPAPSEEPPVSTSNDAPLVTAPLAPAAPTLPGEVTASADVPEAGGVTPLAAPPTGASDSGVVLRVEESPEADEPVLPIAQPAGEAAPESDATPAAPIEPAAPQDELAASEEEASTEPEAPAPEPEAPLPAALPTAEEAAPPLEDATPSDAQQVAALAEQEALPTANTGGFGNLAEGVTVNRPAAETAAEAPPTATAPPALASDPRPVAKFAQWAGWSGPDEKPLFALVLIDEAGDASLLGGHGVI